jgi:hypothetical protein
LILHAAGFDHDRGVFRIVDVWESREVGQRFMGEKLMPIIERMAGERSEEDFRPPDAESWYDLCCGRHRAPRSWRSDACRSRGQNVIAMPARMAGSRGVAQPG